MHRNLLPRLIASLVIVNFSAAGLQRAIATPPAPPNDSPANPTVIGPTLPVKLYDTTVGAANDINTTTIPALAGFTDGPDVFYSFTPTTTATYRIQVYPWHTAPLRSTDRRFVIYVQNSADVFLDGIRAPGDARPVKLDIALTASETYRIGIDHDASTSGFDNFQFTIIVDRLDTTNPDTCATAITLGPAVPAVVVRDITGAVHNYSFTQSADRCSVAGTPTTAPGNDHVYSFTPTASGDYAIELVSDNFDGVLYIDDACPPVFTDGCLGASNHSTGGTSGARHELVVVTLAAGVTYYVFVDNGSTTVLSGPYALTIDQAAAYEVTEVEPNNNSVAASPLMTPLNGGQLVGPLDEDWWTIGAQTGDRVYAWVNNGGSINSTLDTHLAFWAADGTTQIEFDDQDADGADSTDNDLRFVYSTTAAVIAGARLTSNAPHYLQVTDAATNGTVHRYRFHTGVEPASRIPSAEVEPNESAAAADRNARNWFSGVIDRNGDLDTFAIDAVVGDRVFVVLDGDPERDADGFTAPSSDPKAFNGRVQVFDTDGSLILNIGDSNAIQSGPDFPAQAGFFIAKKTGTYHVQVRQNATSQVGPEKTYHLAVFHNEEAPSLVEATDPTLMTTPDYKADTVAVLAEDLGDAGASGICDVSLVNATNLQLIGLSFTPGDPQVAFTVGLVNPALNGEGKLRVTDCEGNTAATLIRIDVTDPACGGVNYSNRTLHSEHGPIFVPDNQPSGPGIDGTITVADAGIVSDVNVTITIETTSAADIDCFLISPTGTTLELITDRGSSSAFNITDATFDDDATEIMPILSGDEPYTGTWLPEGAGGLAVFNGEQAQGTWRLNVRDDSSTENGGSRLVRWSLDINAGFAGPEAHAGTASDTTGFNAGLASIQLTNAVNAQLTVAAGFNPGDPTAEYEVALVDSTTNGSGTIEVTDLQENVCSYAVNLAGLDDTTAPQNSGGVSTSLTFMREVQADVPSGVPAGVTDTLNVSDLVTAAEVEASLTIDTRDIGRLAATLSHDGSFAALLNRVGMEERASVGLTKNTIWVDFDDDAPQADDAHTEPASGTVVFMGLHQPDGRGDFIGDGITSDPRYNMLLKLGNAGGAGNWELFVGDFRLIGTTRSIFRRWSLTLRDPCGPERYVGTAKDITPGTGIASIALAAGATNLAVVADFTPGDAIVSYRVELVDPTQSGSGTVEITDGAGNVAMVPIALAAAAADVTPPQVAGAVDLGADVFDGTATDQSAGDSGIASVTLAPWSTNLQLVSVTPDPPSGAGEVSFVVGLVDPQANGSGYVRVTDVCGRRAHHLVRIDANAPQCTGLVARTKRYLSTDTPIALPDNNLAGVQSVIDVTDAGVIGDLDVTLYITHAFDADIDAVLLTPQFAALFSDIGSTGNDFFNTTLDDEAATPIPDSAAAAPFDGRWQPEDGLTLGIYDGQPVASSYHLLVIDDKANDTGTLDKWALTIESSAFPLRFAGEARDDESLHSGIQSITLLPGATNLTLNVDPFNAGDRLVIFEVTLTDPAGCGLGVVRVTDVAGNVCDSPVALPTTRGDMDLSGTVDTADVAMFITALLDEGYDCLADMKNSGADDGDDVAAFVTCVIDGGC